MTLSDAMSSLLTGGVLSLLAGGVREILRLWGYRMHLRAQQERARLLAEHPAAAEALKAEPISQPPTLGPLAVMLALAGATGAAAGPAAAPYVAAPRPPSEQCKSCDPPCPRGQYCSGGVCVSNAETPEGAAAQLKGGFMTLPGWVDTTGRTPWDRQPERY